MECVCGSSTLDPDNCERCYLLAKIEQLQAENRRLQAEIVVLLNESILCEPEEQEGVSDDE